MQISRTLYFLLLILIVAVSFSFLSSINYPLLNSDDALNVLMAHDYHLPENLYCWEQDRGGTIIPLISQFFIFFGCSALLSISLAAYLILLLGYFAFAEFFKSNFTKLLFASLWFLPFMEFIDILRYPIGMEYSLLGCLIFVLKKIDYSVQSLKPHLLSLLSILIATMAIWTSDLAAPSILLLFTVRFIFKYVQYNRLFEKLGWLYFVIGSIVIAVFIGYAKLNASYHPPEFTQFNDFDGFLGAVSIVFNKIFSILLFRVNNWVLGFLCWLVLAIMIILIALYIGNKINIDKATKPWVTFFLSDYLMTFAIVYSSRWVFLHNMGRWYFVGVYIMAVLLILISYENITTKKWKKGMVILLSIFTLSSALSTFYSLNFRRPGNLLPKVKLTAELEELGPIGIIGEFWKSYIFSVSNPDLIKATPQDGSNVKSQKLVDEVFNQPNIYLAKDMWLDVLPDTIYQFGYQLIKQGDDFEKADCTFARYEKAKLNRGFGIADLKIGDHLTGKDSLQLNVDCDNCRDQFAFYGPYISLGIGKFHANFIIERDSILEPEIIGRLEVTADNGNTYLGQMELFPDMFKGQQSNYISLPFETKQRRKNIEFRFYYFGNANIILKGVRLVEVN